MLKLPWISSFVLLGVTLSLVSSAPQSSPDHDCIGGPLRVDTSKRLIKLRQTFDDSSKTDGKKIDAYIVPSEDAHQSEYVAECDRRRAYVSGFSGSAGTAVITEKKAALWTDGRYFLQAELQLDCNWILMKDHQPGVPTMLEWIESEFKDSRGTTVGVDPSLVSVTDWMVWKDSFEELGITLEPVAQNLVDHVWYERPACSDSPIEVLPLEYAGRSWENKVEDVRKKLREQKVQAIIVSALDELAWLFNLRGSDIPYNPVFFAYAVITLDEVHLFMNNSKVNEAVRSHLNTAACYRSGDSCVRLHDYGTFINFIDTQNWERVLLPSKYSYSGGVSYAVYEKIPENRILMGPSPLLFLKGSKNEVEKKGMRNAHIKDAVALISFLARLEEEVLDGKKWTEVSVAKKLKEYRSMQDGYKGLSFATIAGYGSNGAIIHYKPGPETDKEIGTDSLFLLDSGGQYLDGTTDVTRTLHYGEPTDYEKDMYTRVLSGSVSLAMLEFPMGTKDTRIDILARRPLFEAGKNYNHGTGHGIGAFLNVHESPVQLRYYQEEEHPIREGYYFSDEPGYYEDGKFGIRLETIIESVHRRNTSYGEFLGFNAVTLVPFEPKLIKWELLTKKQIDWLNKYNAKIRTTIGPLLERLDDDGRAKNWMVARTELITPQYDSLNSASSVGLGTATLWSLLTVSFHMVLMR